MKTTLRFKLIALFLFGLQQITLGQSTWIKTFYYDIGSIQYYVQDSTNVGAFEFAECTNGNYFLLSQDDEGQTQTLYLVDSAGNSIHRSIPVGYHGTLTKTNSYGLQSTPDSGCVFIKHYDDFNGFPTQLQTWTILKLYPNGNSQWARSFDYQEVRQIVPKGVSGYYAIIDDTLYELGTYGNQVAVGFPETGTISVLPDSDIIESTDSFITRKDFAGNVRWIIPANGREVFSATATSIYAGHLSSDVVRINSTTGNIMWTHNFGYIKKLSHTYNDGLAAINHPSARFNGIVVADSSGNILNQKTFDFCQFGFLGIKGNKDKSILVGAPWRSQMIHAPHFGYSPYMIKLDEFANGVVDSSEYFWAENAGNDSSVISFPDDAVYVAAAQGSIGTRRDSMESYSGPEICYAADWDDRFTTGLNHKYSDCDGSGVIDTSDLWSLAGNFFSPHGFHSDTAAQTGPPIHYAVQGTSFLPGDTISVNVILASPTYVLDSIYAISLDCKLKYYYQNMSPPAPLFNSFQYLSNVRIEIPNNTMGDTAVNLFHYSFYNYNVYSYVALSRTDHQNATVDGDTIATFICVLSPQFILSGSFTFGGDFHAISKDGYTIPLTGEGDSITIQGINSVRDFELENVSVSPNPANEYVNISSPNKSIDKLIVYNLQGERVFSQINLQKNFKLDTRKFAPGVYVVEMLVGEKRIQRKISILHR